MTTEIVYLDHDNTIDLILKKRVPPTKVAAAEDLSPVTRITLTIGGTLIDSDDVGTPITWTDSSQETGEVHFDLGGYDLVVGHHIDCPIIVYDTSHTDGLVWDHINIDVIADQEGS